MRNHYRIIVFGTVLLFLGLLWMPLAPAQSIGQALGLEKGAGIQGPEIRFPADRQLIHQMIRTTGVILVPYDITIASFDPADGAYLGDFITYTGLLWPVEVNMGPDGYIYVSDGWADSVFRFDTYGDYVDTYADSSDGLTGINYGIGFRGGHVFLVHTADFATFYVAEFDGPHSKVGNFITSTNNWLYDILFLADNSCLITDLINDTMLHYDASGNLIGTVFTDSGFCQVQNDTASPGDYLTSAIHSSGDGHIREFDVDGTTYDDLVVATGGGAWGVNRLANGNYLLSAIPGVYEVEAGTGNILQTLLSGMQGRMQTFAQIASVFPPVLDIKCNGGDSGVVVSSSTNVKLTMDVEARDGAGYNVDVFCFVKRMGGGVYSYDGLSWGPGTGSFYYSGPLIDMTDTIADQPVPVGSYNAYLVLDHKQNGKFDAVYDYDMVDFQVIP